MEKKKYDTTLARIAGNIAAGYVGRDGLSKSFIASESLELAKLIVAELEAKPAEDPVLQFVKTIAKDGTYGDDPEGWRLAAQQILMGVSHG